MPTLADLLNMVRTSLSTGQNRQRMLAHILTGPQCEQWLNPESRAAVNIVNPNRNEFFTAELVLGGAQRADLVLQRPNSAATAHDVLQIGEGKVIPNKGNAKIDAPLQELKRQLDGHRAYFVQAEVFGLIYAVAAALFEGPK